jgi:5-methylcytosine-specific restriction endonuclease McrA
MITTLAQYPVEHILPMIQQGSHKQPLALPDGEVHLVRVNTPRLLCLKNSQSCAWCQRTGSVFLLQRHTNEVPHLNLFWLSQKHQNANWVAQRTDHLVMMTQDHIIPKGMGGRDDPENLMTMCSECNQAKGKRLPLTFVLKMTSWPIVIPVES